MNRRARSKILPTRVPSRSSITALMDSRIPGVFSHWSGRTGAGRREPPCRKLTLRLHGPLRATVCRPLTLDLGRCPRTPRLRAAVRRRRIGRPVRETVIRHHASFQGDRLILLSRNDLARRCRRAAACGGRGRATNFDRPDRPGRARWLVTPCRLRTPKHGDDPKYAESGSIHSMSSVCRPLSDVGPV